jgi:hypothetical protein
MTSRKACSQTSLTLTQGTCEKLLHSIIRLAMTNIFINSLYENNSQSCMLGTVSMSKTFIHICEVRQYIFSSGSNAANDLMAQYSLLRPYFRLKFTVVLVMRLFCSEQMNHHVEFQIMHSTLSCRILAY